MEQAKRQQSEEERRRKKSVWCKLSWDKLKPLSSVFLEPLMLLIFNFTCKAGAGFFFWCWYRAYLKQYKTKRSAASKAAFYESEKRCDWIYQISLIHIVHLMRCASTIKWFMLNIMNFLCALIDRRFIDCRQSEYTSKITSLKMCLESKTRNMWGGKRKMNLI